MRKKKITQKNMGNTDSEGVGAKSEITAVHKEIKEVAIKVDRILRTLIGDEEMAQTGLVSKVEKQEQWINNQKLILAKIFGIAIGSGIFGGAVIQIVMKFMKFI